MYTNKFIDAVTQLGTVPSTGTLLGPTSSTGQFQYSWLCNTPISISRVFFTVTQTFKGTAGGTIPIQLNMQPVFNSTSASVTICSLNIPTTAVLGSIFYKEIPPNTNLSGSTGVGAGVGAAGGGYVPAGYQVIPQWTTAPSSGGGIFDFEAEYNPEGPKNWAPLANIILNNV